MGERRYDVDRIIFTTHQPVVVLPVAIVTGAIRNAFVLEGVNHILGEFPSDRDGIASFHKFLYTVVKQFSGQYLKRWLI